MKSPHVRNLAIVIMCLTVSLPSALAISFNQTDDFQDGTTEEWGGNIRGTVENIATGGPEGEGDRFLQTSVTSYHLGVKNTDQWTGDYLAEGIQAIEMDLNHINPGSDAVNVRILLFGPGGTFASQSLTPVTSNQWTHYIFGLTSSDLVHVTGGTGVLDDTLSGVTTLLVRHDSPTPTPPGEHPPHITATLGIDNISPGDIPGEAILIAPSGTPQNPPPYYWWYQVSGATYYHLLVQNASGTPVIQKWYTALEANCNGNWCWVSDNTAQLESGEHTWRIVAWNSYGYGPWSSEMSFSVPEAADSVSISTSSITWQTYNYSLTSDHLIASHDPNMIVSHTYTTYIIENNYLKLTIVPGFGGRLLSMYNKVTGHEELYQNPVGAPYGSGIFYYDWLMIWGGIFPTFPEPEHGKTWLRAWSFQTVTNTADEVTIAMSYQDNDGPVRGRYTAGITNVTCTFYVTLKAGRTAVDIKIVLKNAKSTEVTNFEYWTNTGLAPGSTPGDTRLTDNAEIVVPHEDTFQIVRGVGCGAAWDSCKWFVNHTRDGIIYASPNMKGRNFWGVINHDNDEGVFRISDNSITQGLKIWTFGYDSVNVDPYAGGPEQNKRPFLELWAGLTPQFWQDTTLAANSETVITEVYSPSVGMQDVTHATDRVLANLTETICQLYFMNLDDTYQVTLTRHNGATLVYSGSVTPDPANGHTIPVSGSGELELVITDGSGAVIFDDTSSGPPMKKRRLPHNPG